MTSHGAGLSDNARTAIGIAFSAILAINASMAGLAASNMMEINPGIYFALGIAAVVIYAVKDQLGIRDSTVAAVARVSDKTYPTTRTPDHPVTKTG